MTIIENRILKLKLLKGFTLIELLVTISIIGILSAFSIANLTGFRERSRDTQRKKDLQTIRTGLELYRSDVLSYPGALPACNASLTFGTATYIQRTPCDPTNSGAYVYTYTRTGPNTYTLRGCLETGNDRERDNPKQSCAAAPASFTVQNP